MKTQSLGFSQRWRRLFRRRTRRHDRMLVLNLSSFNYLTGWDRMLAKNEYERRTQL